jgi:hypothetical protein
VAGITSTGRGYLAACLAIKNQAEDVREWALHHLALGVTKIYIKEHNSSSPALGAIQDLVDAGGPACIPSDNTTPHARQDEDVLHCGLRMDEPVCRHCGL